MNAMATRKLLLVSLGLGGVPAFVGDPRGKSLAFIPTAGEPYEDRSFVERDRSTLNEMGFVLREVDLATSTGDELRSRLTGVDVIFVAGGNSFYLLQEARESGFSQILGDLLDQGVLYIGASAGAVLVGPDLRPVATLDDPDEAPQLPDMQGLGLVDFVVLPHYGDEKYLPEYESIIKRFEGELRVIPLRNDQAVLVTGGSHEVIQSEE